MNKDYKLEVPKTTKSLIQQPKIATDGVLPELCFNMVITGMPKSGKTVLWFNLIKNFYKDAFDMVVLISPSGGSDDIVKALGLPPSRIITDMDKAEECLEKILDIQKESVEKEGSFEHVKKVCIVLDDVVGHKDFMKCNALLATVIKNRHHNISTILNSQYFKLIPRNVRLQASCFMFFNCSESELETIADDHCPPGVPTRKFIERLEKELEEKHAFVTINITSPWNQRFRKGLAQVIDFSGEVEDNKKKRKPNPKDFENGQRPADSDPSVDLSPPNSTDVRKTNN